MKARLQFIAVLLVALAPFFALADDKGIVVKDLEGEDFTIEKHVSVIEPVSNNTHIEKSETISRPPARKKEIFLLKDRLNEKAERAKKTKELYNSIMLANAPEPARQENFIKNKRSGYGFLQKQKAEKYHDVPKFVFDLSAVSSITYQVEHALILAVIKKESNFDPNAKNDQTNASGLMQLMPGTANDLDVKDPFNPEQNIDGGVRYLRWLLDRYDGNYQLALAAYNAGYAVVDGFKGVPQNKETPEFVETVMKYYSEYKTN